MKFTKVGTIRYTGVNFHENISRENFGEICEPDLDTVFIHPFRKQDPTKYICIWQDPARSGTRGRYRGGGAVWYLPIPSPIWVNSLVLPRGSSLGPESASCSRNLTASTTPAHGQINSVLSEQIHVSRKKFDGFIIWKRHAICQILIGYCQLLGEQTDNKHFGISIINDI